MGHLEVDPEELVALGAQLDRIRLELKGIGDRLRIGGELHVRVLDVQGHYALQKISEHACGVAGNLRAAGGAYQKAEQEIARAAGG